MARRRREWKELEELVDSDTTFSGRRSQRVARSAFFADSTDEEQDMAHVPSRSQSPRLQKEQAVRENDGINQKTAAKQRQRDDNVHMYFGDIEFPATRVVLWDRRVLAPSATVTAAQVMPRFVLSPTALQHCLGHVQASLDVPGGAFGVCCHLIPMSGSDSAWTRRVDFDAVSSMAPKDDLATESLAEWRVPVLRCDPHMIQHGIPRSAEKLSLTKDKYRAMIQNVCDAFAEDTEESALVTSHRMQCHVLATSCHKAQLDFVWELIWPTISFRFSLIRNLPLLMTPLAVALGQRSLSADFDASSRRTSAAASSCCRRFGFVTLDRTRKAVPLLHSDPLVLQRPIVGVWITGISTSDDWTQQAAFLVDPWLYAVCMTFLASKRVKERAEVSPRSFLVMVYPSPNAEGGGLVTGLPRFLECSWSLPRDTSSPPLGLYRAHQSVLAGVSHFEATIEMDVQKTCATNTCWQQALLEAAPLLPGPFNTSESPVQMSHSLPLPPRMNNEDRATTTQMVKDSFLSDTEVRPRIHKSEPAEPESSPLLSPVQRKRPQQPQSPARLQSQSDAEDVLDQSVESIDPTLIVTEFTSRSGGTSSRRGTCTGSISDPTCMNSQLLLTMQHQQILENQQKQICELQQQLQHLRKVLQLSRQMETVVTVGSATTERDLGAKTTSDITSAMADGKQHAATRVQQPETPQAAPYRVEDHAITKQGQQGHPSSLLSSLDLSSISDSNSISSLGSFGVNSVLRSSQQQQQVQGQLDEQDEEEKEEEIREQKHDKSEDVQCEQQPTAVTEELVHSELPTGEKSDIGSESKVAQVKEPTRPANNLGERNNDDELVARVEPSGLTSSVSNATCGLNDSHVSAGNDDDDDDDDADDDKDSGIEDYEFIASSMRLCGPESLLKTTRTTASRRNYSASASPVDWSSYTVPKIKVALEEVVSLESDSEEDEEMRRIMKKYTRRVQKSRIEKQ